MRKVTPRRLSSLDVGENVTVKFTRVEGRRGENVTHEGIIDATDDETLTYSIGNDTYEFELDTGYIRDGDNVVGRDGSAKIEAE